jgi:hypothetical protein
MKLLLTTWQRVMLSTVVGNMQGDVRLMHTAIKAMDALELTTEEIQAVGFSILPDGQPQWKNAEHRFELEFEDAKIVNLLKQGVASFKGWPFFNYQQVLNLCEQLDIVLDDE